MNRFCVLLVSLELGKHSRSSRACRGRGFLYYLDPIILLVVFVSFSYPLCVYGRKCFACMCEHEYWVRPHQFFWK